MSMEEELVQERLINRLESDKDIKNIRTRLLD
jgi:hypothetical protein